MRKNIFVVVQVMHGPTCLICNGGKCRAPRNPPHHAMRTRCAGCASSMQRAFSLHPRTPGHHQGVPHAPVNERHRPKLNHLGKPALSSLKPPSSSQADKKHNGASHMHNTFWATIPCTNYPWQQCDKRQVRRQDLNHRAGGCETPTQLNRN